MTMNGNYYNIYSIPSPQFGATQSSSSPSSGTTERSSDKTGGYYYRDDSIYSTTPFVGSSNSVLSPSHTAQERMTPQSQKGGDLITFDFPPELLPSASSESSSSSAGSSASYPNVQQHQEQALVPYYAPPPPQKALSSYPTTREPLTAYSSNTNQNSLTLSNSPKLHKKIRVPRSHNPYGADAVHPKKKTMKNQRKRRTAAGAVGGMVVGGLVLGPVGVVVGAAAGGVATNRIHKARERSAQRKYEQENFQRAANKSRVHKGAFA